MKKIIAALAISIACGNMAKAQTKTIDVKAIENKTYTFTAVGQPFTIGKHVFIDHNDEIHGNAYFYVGKATDGNYYATSWNMLEDDVTLGNIMESKFNLDVVKKLELQYANISNDYHLQNKIWIVHIKMKNPNYEPCFFHTQYNYYNTNQLYLSADSEMYAYFKTEDAAKGFTALFK